MAALIPMVHVIQLDQVDHEMVHVDPSWDLVVHVDQLLTSLDHLDLLMMVAFQVDLMMVPLVHVVLHVDQGLHVDQEHLEELRVDPALVQRLIRVVPMDHENPDHENSVGHVILDHEDHALNHKDLMEEVHEMT